MMLRVTDETLKYDSLGRRQRLVHRPQFQPSKLHVLFHSKHVNAGHTSTYPADPGRVEPCRSAHEVAAEAPEVGLEMFDSTAS